QPAATAPALPGSWRGGDRGVRHPLRREKHLGRHGGHAHDPAPDAERMSAAERAISALVALMARLRDPNGGCPWDREQTFASIAPYTIEEAYEVADAIEHGNPDKLRDELGDLLFQVVFHARMAE